MLPVVKLSGTNVSPLKPTDSKAITECGWSIDMGELYSDLDLLDDIIRALGKNGPMDAKALAKEVGHGEEAVIEQLTESYYFQPAASPGKLGRYELSGRGIERFEKIS